MKITDIPPGRFRNATTHGITIRTNVRELALAGLVAKWRQSRYPRTQASLINWIDHHAGAGYRASVPVSQLPRGHYRKVKAINNTQLSRFKAELDGKTINLPDRALVFGSAFHCLILEPELFDLREYCLRPSEAETLMKMADKFRSHPAAKHIHRKDNEIPVFWTDEETGLPCKALIDNLKPQGIICDLKTTFARTETQFREDAIKYGYNRQTAGYTIGATQHLGKDAFKIEVLGIQKLAPYSVFCLQFDASTSFYNTGLQEYRDLLEKWKEAGRVISR